MKLQALGAAAAALGGLVTVLGGIGGLSWWSTRNAPEAVEDWHPQCAKRMGWETIEIESTSTPAGDAYRIFGLDKSPSNSVVEQQQLEAVAEAAKAQAAEKGVAILLVSDQSDLSITPDLPLEMPQGGYALETVGLDCWPNCKTDSLFAQKCFEQLEEAMEERAKTVVAEAGAGLEQARLDRNARIDAWSQEVADFHPKPGTSLVRFWHKVADLPAVKRKPAAIDVVLMSDLEEAKSKDRNDLRRFVRDYEKQGACPDSVEYPALGQVHVTLVQTVTDSIDADRWGEQWEDYLECSGAFVTRHRYSPAVPLTEYMAGDDG